MKIPSKLYSAHRRLLADALARSANTPATKKYIRRAIVVFIVFCLAYVWSVDARADWEVNDTVMITATSVGSINVAVSVGMATDCTNPRFILGIFTPRPVKSESFQMRIVARVDSNEFEYEHKSFEFKPFVTTNPGTAGYMSIGHKPFNVDMFAELLDGSLLVVQFGRVGEEEFGITAGFDITGGMVAYYELLGHCTLKQSGAEFDGVVY